MLAWIDEQSPLPPASAALGPGSEAPGLVAAGGSVHPARLQEAYGKGIFPWYSAGQPVLYYENIEGGHGGAADNGQRAHLQALEFAYLWSRLGDR